MEKNKISNSRIYLASTKNLPKNIKVLEGERGGLYYIAPQSGKIKYIYPEGESPQKKYSLSEKGQVSEKRRRNSLKRKEYLREYYLIHRNKKNMFESKIKGEG
jgi:hypothetical protein|tara:strand:+ start:702 stop:1010 length:309 start_codon:yes stop_codon:yes gene_type:complete